MLFRDIPGQKEIKAYLRKMVNDSRISHAILFHGPKGSGKLALALAFARYISCTEKTDEDSCGICVSCLKYSKLAHPDLHFVFPVASKDKKEDSSADKKDEAPSEAFLDKWREALTENPYMDQYQWYEKIGIENKQGIITKKESTLIMRKLSLKPYESEYKILIMWMPELMHINASNRLLKIIEEPPPNTIFLLVSDNVSDIIPTIQSRTQMIKISGFSDEEIREGLLSKTKAEPAVIDDAVSLAAGDFNKALEYVLKDEENVNKFELFVSYMRLCFSGDIISLLSWVEDLSKTGREYQKMFLSYGIRMLRENLLLNRGLHAISHMSGYELEWSHRFCKFISEENIKDLYEEFNLAYNHISANGYSRLVLLDLGLKVGSLINKS